MMYRFFSALISSNEEILSSGDIISGGDILSGTDVVSAADAGFRFEPDNFIQALPTMGICLLSIFVVMITIILITSLLNRITAGGEE